MLKRIVVLLFFSLNIHYSQNPSDIFDNAYSEVLDNGGYNRGLITSYEPYEPYSRNLYEVSFEKLSEKNNYPFFQKRIYEKIFDLKIKPFIEYIPSKDSEYFTKSLVFEDLNKPRILGGKLFNLDPFRKIIIGENTYERLYEYLFFIEGKDRISDNFLNEIPFCLDDPECNRNPTTREDIISRYRGKIFRFCKKNNCTIYLQSEILDALNQEYIYGDTYFIDLNKVNSKLNSTNSYESNEIKFRSTDPFSEGNFEDYKLLFYDDNWIRNVIDKLYGEKIKFSLNNDFELFFNLVNDATYNDFDWTVDVALGFKEPGVSKSWNSLISKRGNLNPYPEIDSRKNHISFKIKQVKGQYAGVEKTLLYVKKYKRGIKVIDQAFNIKNYLKVNPYGQPEPYDNLIKVTRINDVIYFSIEDDVLYKTEIEEFENDKILITHKSIYEGEKDYLKKQNISKLLTVNFSNQLIKPEIIINEDIEKPSWNGSGSGFFISKFGHITTNYHVIKDAKTIEISYNNGNNIIKYPAEIIQSDPANDLAILKVKDLNFKEFDELPYNIKTRSSDVGSDVFALGYPMALSGMGEEIKFTDGKISSKTGFNGDIRTYQTTAPIQSGNSGGPLFDYNGNLIGINSSKISSQVADNVSYSIKSSYLNNLMDVLPENISLPSDKTLSGKPLTEIIKILSKYVVLIKVK